MEDPPSSWTCRQVMAWFDSKLQPHHAPLRGVFASLGLTGAALLRLTPSDLSNALCFVDPSQIDQILLEITQLVSKEETMNMALAMELWEEDTKQLLGGGGDFHSNLDTGRT